MFFMRHTVYIMYFKCSVYDMYINIFTERSSRCKNKRCRLIKNAAWTAKEVSNCWC